MNNCQQDLWTAVRAFGVPEIPQAVMPVVVQHWHQSIRCPHGVTYWYEADRPTVPDMVAEAVKW